MTPPPSSALAGHARAVPPEARHRHDNACYWDVDTCRWQCVPHPGVPYALDHCTGIGRPVPDSGQETMP